MRITSTRYTLLDMFFELLRRLFEYNLFGVCAYIGQKIGIASSRIRLFFIYTTLLTFGSPVIFYFIFAFWLNLAQSIRFKKRNPVRDF